jgi:hypothetical protein
VKLSQRTLGLLAAATTIVAAFFWFWPPRTSSGADLLPATTPVFVQIPNVTATTARWAQTQAAAVVAKLREGAAAQGAGGLMTKRWGSLFDAIVRGAADLADGEAFVALTGLQTTPRIAPQLVVGIQIGHHGPQARQWLDQLKRQLKRDFPAADFSDQRYFKTDYQQWRLEPGLDICAATLADRLVLTLCAAPMMEIIDRCRDSSRATLAGSEAFRATRVRLPDHADWLLIAQTEPLAQTLVSAMDATVTGTRQAARATRRHRRGAGLRRRPGAGCADGGAQSVPHPAVPSLQACVAGAFAGVVRRGRDGRRAGRRRLRPCHSDDPRIGQPRMDEGADAF